MSERENRLNLAGAQPPGGAEKRSVHDSLLERYLSWLQAHPAVHEATAPPRRQHTLMWATDELRQTASTLVGLSMDDAEYELKAVLREVLERLGVAGEVPPAEAEPEPENP